MLAKVTGIAPIIDRASFGFTTAGTMVGIPGMLIGIAPAMDWTSIETGAAGKVVGIAPIIDCTATEPIIDVRDVGIAPMKGWI